MRGLIILIGSVDASYSQILAFHLSHPNAEGGRSINHHVSKSYLSHATIPRKELSALTLGSVLFSIIKKELGKRLGQAIICSDSKICIHWSTRGSEQLQPYILNRVETIRAHIDVLDELHYVRSKFNVAENSRL